MTSPSGNYFDFLGVNNTIAFYRGLFLRSGDVEYPILVNSLVPLVLSNTGEPMIGVVLYIHISGDGIHKSEVVTVRLFHQAKHLNNIHGAGNMDKIRMLNTFGKAMDYELVTIHHKKTMRFDTFCTAVLTGMTCLEKIFHWAIPVAPFYDILPPGWLSNNALDVPQPCIRIITHEWFARLLKLRRILDTRVSGANLKEFASYAYQALSRSILPHCNRNDRMLILLHKKCPLRNLCSTLLNNLECGAIEPPQLRKGFSKRCKRWFYPMKINGHHSASSNSRLVFMSPLYTSNHMLMPIPFGQKRRGRPRKINDEVFPVCTLSSDKDESNEVQGNLDDDYSSCSSKDEVSTERGSINEVTNPRGNTTSRSFTRTSELTTSKRGDQIKLGRTKGLIGVRRYDRQKKRPKPYERSVNRTGDFIITLNDKKKRKRVKKLFTKVKRRGRPPKNLTEEKDATPNAKSVSSSTVNVTQTVVNSVLNLGRRRRGRPPKITFGQMMKSSASPLNISSKSSESETKMISKNIFTDCKTSPSVSAVVNSTKLSSVVPKLRRGPGRPRKGENYVSERRKYQKQRKVISSTNSLDHTIAVVSALSGDVNNLSVSTPPLSMNASDVDSVTTSLLSSSPAFSTALTSSSTTTTLTVYSSAPSISSSFSKNNFHMPSIPSLSHLTTSTSLIARQSSSLNGTQKSNLISDSRSVARSLSTTTTLCIKKEPSTVSTTDGTTNSHTGIRPPIGESSLSTLAKISPSTKLEQTSSSSIPLKTFANCDSLMAIAGHKRKADGVISDIRYSVVGQSPSAGTPILSHSNKQLTAPMSTLLPSSLSNVPKVNRQSTLSNTSFSTVNNNHLSYRYSLSSPSSSSSTTSTLPSLSSLNSIISNNVIPSSTVTCSSSTTPVSHLHKSPADLRVTAVTNSISNHHLSRSQIHALPSSTHTHPQQNSHQISCNGIMENTPSRRSSSSTEVIQNPPLPSMWAQRNYFYDSHHESCKPVIVSGVHDAPLKIQPSATIVSKSNGITTDAMLFSHSNPYPSLTASLPLNIPTSLNTQIGGSSQGSNLPMNPVHISIADSLVPNGFLSSNSLITAHQLGTAISANAIHNAAKVASTSNTLSQVLKSFNLAPSTSVSPSLMTFQINPGSSTLSSTNSGFNTNFSNTLMSSLPSQQSQLSTTPAPQQLFFQPSALSSATSTLFTAPNTYNCHIPQPLHVQLQPAAINGLSLTSAAVGSMQAGSTSAPATFLPNPHGMPNSLHGSANNMTAGGAVQTPVIFYFHHPGMTSGIPSNTSTLMGIGTNPVGTGTVMNRITNSVNSENAAANEQTSPPLILIPQYPPSGMATALGQLTPH